MASAWGDRWRELGLYWIVGARSPAGGFAYELRTQDEKVRVVWGAAEGGESASEPSAEEKIAALERHVQEKGPLEKSGGAVVDLRELARKR